MCVEIRSSRVLKAANSGHQQGVVATDRQLLERHAAVPDTVPLVRASVLAFARDVGMGDKQLESVRLAVSEAVTNVVRHAYPHGGGTVRVTASRAADELWVLVADDGCGHQSPSHNPGLGLGLGIIAHECDELVIAERAEGGTELRMRFALGSDTAPAPATPARRRKSHYSRDSRP